MAYVAGRIISQVARYYGPSAWARTAKAFNRYDVKIHRGLYGASGGRGVRHGRDAGSAIAGLYQGTRSGDDLDNGSGFQPQYSSRSKPKAYRGRSNKRSPSSAVCRACNRGSSRANSGRYNSGKRRFYR